MVVVVKIKKEERMKVFNFQQNKAVAELEDAGIRAAIVVQERVKCAHTDANALANALEDASVLLALATADALNLSAPRNACLVVTDAGVRGSHSCIIVVS